MDGTVLVADDDRTLRTVLTQALGRAGCRVHATSSLTTLLRWVEEGRGDVVITDVMMPDGDGLEMLPKIAADRPGLPVIVISARNTIMTAIEAAEREAWDYLPKPFDLPDLMKRVSKALAARPARAEAEPPAEAAAGGNDDLPLIGASAPMQDLYRLVARLVGSDLALVVSGPTGAGKTLLAQAIHAASSRAEAPFVTLTAADAADDGALAARIEAAGAGTLLIEEPAQMPLEAQIRLARQLDGAPARARPIATLTEPAAGLIEQGRLSADLYYRLAGATLALPPLSERGEDVMLLARHFLAEAAGGGRRRNLDDAARAPLMAHPWPGNVRELRNLMRRLALVGGEPGIGAEEVALALAAQPGGAPAAAGFGPDERLSEAVARHVRRYFDAHGDALPPPGLYGRVLREIEAPLLEIALEATGGNQLRCAELLGINRNTLRKKLSDHEIRVTGRRKLM